MGKRAPTLEEASTVQAPAQWQVLTTTCIRTWHCITVILDLHASVLPTVLVQYPECEY